MCLRNMEFYNSSSYAIFSQWSCVNSSSMKSKARKSITLLNVEHTLLILFFFTYFKNMARS